MSPKSKSKAPPCTEADKQAVHVWLTHKLDISQRALTRLKALCDETNPDTWEEKTLHQCVRLILMPWRTIVKER